MFQLNMPNVKAKRIEEFSFYNHNVYELISGIYGFTSKMYIIEICDDDNLMTYQLTKNPNSKNYNDVIFEWETYWDDRIKFED